MGEVEYYAIDGVPGRYFKCPKGVGKLSDKACGKLYTEAMSPKGLSEGLRFQCRACQLGAEHAGVKPLEAAAAQFLGASTCARCIRPANRLIRGLICISCYNREREVLIGRNAKGNKPVRSRPVGPVSVMVIDEDGQRIKQVDRVASHTEAVFSVMRMESCSARGFLWVGPALKREDGVAAKPVRAA